MLARMLRTAFTRRRRVSHGAPSAEQNRLLEQAAGAVEGGQMQGLDAILAAAANSQPACAVLHRSLGSLLGRNGRLDLAREQFELALVLEPDHPEALTDLGNVHSLAGRYDEAEACYRRALALNPNDEAIGLNLASMQIRAGRHEPALERLRGLVEASGTPQAVEGLCNLLDRLNRSDEAREICLRLLARQPSHGAAHAALGFVLLKREFRPQQALEHFEQALATGFRNTQLFSNRGIALQDLGRLDEAIASYDEALVLTPGDPLARFHRSLALLMCGEFGRGWPDYEQRLVSEGRQSPPRTLPVWDGKPLPEGKLLVYGEQGIGDEIMFASCLPDLLAQCPRVALVCTAKLEPIFRRSFPQAEVAAFESARDPAAPLLVDAQKMIPIGSLPLLYRCSRDRFPRHDGYLHADPALARAYRERLDALGPGLKIGLSWRGGTDRSRRGLRSLDLDQLAPVFSLPGARFINLQYDSRADEPGVSGLVAAGTLVHWQDALDDYDRTAALVSSLDVVVSVCTAVIHLAGALGRPTLVMAPFSPEWRYGIAGHEMPWYPTVRIERQNSPGDWTPGVSVVRERLLAMSVRTENASLHGA